MDKTTGPDEPIAKMKAQAAEAAERGKETASGAADQAGRTAEAAWREAKNKTSDLRSVCEAYVREKPSRALLIGLGIGFLIGLFARW